MEGTSLTRRSFIAGAGSLVAAAALAPVASTLAPTRYFAPASGVIPVLIRSFELQTPPSLRAAVMFRVAVSPEAVTVCS